MELDPQAEALRALMASSGLPPIQDGSVAEARAGTAALLPLQGDPQPVERVEDIKVGGADGALPARLYAPRGSAGAPIVVYFHGGGWVIGDLDLLDRPCRALANAAGCVVVSVDYRLAPETSFPGAAEDAYAATVWLAEHGIDVGGDPARIVVAGDSAGGNLAAVTAILARDRGGPPIALQILYCPVTAAPDPERFASYREVGEGYMLTAAAMEWFWGHYSGRPEDRADVRVSPLDAPDLSGLPPALVMVAGFDPLRDEGVAYAGRLQAAGGRVELVQYEGQMHDPLWVMGALDAATEAIGHMAGAVRQLAG